MDIMRYIAEQMRATRLPLVAITVAAVPCPETPIILTLHWHGFVRERLAQVPQAQDVRYTSVPSSALQLNLRWDDVLELDRANLDAAWAMGAWSMSRNEHSGCMRPGAPTTEAVECLQAFGMAPFSPAGAPAIVAEAPDADDLLDVASRRGYVKWTFHPVHGGIWHALADDETLRPDGTRELPCPMHSIATDTRGVRKTVYQFGRSSRLLT